MVESSLKGWKTLWEKEKLLVTSNFSYSYSVYERLLQQTRKKQGLFGKQSNMHVKPHVLFFFRKTTHESDAIGNGGKNSETQRMENVFETAENIVERRKCWLPTFSSFQLSHLEVFSFFQMCLLLVNIR